MEVVLFANKKGGTGKTTSALNFCAGLGKMGYKVLGIDLDGQANFTTDSGGEELGSVMGSFDFIFGASLEDTVQHNELYDFLGADKRFSNKKAAFEEKGSDFLLKKALSKITGYDYVVLDIPPDMSGVVFLALVAANKVIAVCDADARAVTGLADLTSAMQRAKDYNDSLEMAGILITRDVPRTTANKFIHDVFTDAAASIGTKVFNTVIKDRTAFHQATALHTNVIAMDAKCAGAKEYLDFVKEYLQANKQ